MSNRYPYSGSAQESQKCVALIIIIRLIYYPLEGCEPSMGWNTKQALKMMYMMNLYTSKSYFVVIIIMILWDKKP